MDTQNYEKSVQAASLAELPRHKIVVGAKQLRKALCSGQAQKVFLARNADPAVTEPLETLCREKHVEYVLVQSMQELGKTCGIEVPAAAAAILN